MINECVFLEPQLHVFVPVTHRYTHTHTRFYTYLNDLGVCAAAVPRRGMHPACTFSQLQWEVGVSSAGALLSERALPVLDAPATFKPGVSLQTHAAAVPQSSALVQMSCERQRKTRFSM